MELQEKISNDLKEAIKAKSALRVSCLRMLKTALKTKQAETGNELTDPDALAVVSSLIRKGQDAAKEFRDAGREEMAAKEEEETKIFFEYMPEQLDSVKVEGTIREIISELGANSPRDLGKVMKAAMARMAGQVQGKEVSEIAKKLLS